MDTKNLFETFQKYAFRLEGLPVYSVAEEKGSFDTFLRSGEVTGESEWQALVAKNVGDGKKMERLRLFSEQLTDYERYEIQAYSGPTAGEDIRVVRREDFIHDYSYDFWFFDDEWIAQMSYENDGTFKEMDVRRATTDEISMYTYWRGVYENAQPLRQIPFIANTPDDTHCLQAAYMSIAQHFDPNFAIQMDEWSELTGYEEGLGTWANAGLVWFHENGYEVVHYELFDFDAFIAQPKDYMIELHGQEAGTWGIEHTNVPAEIVRMKKLVAAGITQRRRPDIDDIKRFLNDGYLVRVTLNCGALNGTGEYVGHAVVVTGYSDTHITFHDPGLPPIPNRQVTLDVFEAAWSAQEKELDAIRRQ